MKRVVSILMFGLMAAGAFAVPANPRPMPYVQPNGDTLIVRLVGDERMHFHTTVDGYLIKKDKWGYFRYAKWKEVKDKDGNIRREARATLRRAHNADKRTRAEQRWLERQSAKGNNVR